MKIKPKEKQRLKLIGERIKEIRKRKKISMEEVEGTDGPSWRFQSKIEMQGTNFSIVTLLKIAEALDVDPIDLLRGI